MEVSSIMVTDVKTVKSYDTAREAVLIMNKHKIGSVVVAEDRNVVGIITERDILKRVVALNKNSESVLCKDIMSKPVITIDANADVVDAVELMAEHKIKKLCVVKNGKLVGILTATDIIKSGENIEYEVLKKLAQFFPVYKHLPSFGG